MPSDTVQHWNVYAQLLRLIIKNFIHLKNQDRGLTNNDHNEHYSADQQCLTTEYTLELKFKAGE